jgi:hypothetical protein
LKRFWARLTNQGAIFTSQAFLEEFRELGLPSWRTGFLELASLFLDQG